MEDAESFCLNMDRCELRGGMRRGDTSLAPNAWLAPKYSAFSSEVSSMLRREVVICLDAVYHMKKKKTNDKGKVSP